MTTDAEMSHKILPSADPAWHRSWVEDIIEPALPIIDAHHHLWDLPRGPYLGDDYMGDLLAGHNVVATIYAECTEAYRADGAPALRSVGETEFVARTARAQDAAHPDGPRMALGIVGRVDMENGAAVREALEAHIAAGDGRFRGVRFSTAWDPDPAIRSTIRTPPPRLLYDKQVREGIACLASLGLVLDNWVYHHQLQDVADLAKALPDARIVLDHVGGPLRIGDYANRKEAVYADWLKGIQAVAEQPNVTLKVGGLGMHTIGFDFASRSRAPSSEDLAAAWRPFVEPCIETFGTDRIIFESNFPVDGASASYAVLWNAYKRLVAGASPAEKQAMFHDNAARIYNLDLGERQS